MLPQTPTFPTVLDIHVFEAGGPWKTKSGGNLAIQFGAPGIPFQMIMEYFQYEAEDLSRQKDLKGFRIYTVRDLPAGTIGGTEWHRVRQEMVFALDGKVEWECEDVSGNHRSFVLDGVVGIWMPPYILHAYKAQVQGSGLLVVANTLFYPEDKATHDTYSQETFRDLQAELG
ncbi:MAG: hypothetical protein A3G11_02085 [Candidatus Lloydbacteria bacterium RIFCSPLOWO2_12_FULL_51_9]|uniref:Sugar 3,4-ketoisomerase QdtA cupin domain-containing protein n=2 Tax=Candidatus Lloydiibacteriota TaxID=1817910 RepID=A0A1G2DWC0_9BACT|nr:MAG: hypothetical protein A3J08_02700 [Candidatus Lloydbacteria bacterium RIFCSPLOWO2_02_FULL_51_11]OGZ17200.1 MAG: hypothetical protein A3G11_02085 [Candidatus Lloydbacteria bacterium RIFCSPLOWO2_12_FULL_51_9]